MQSKLFILCLAFVQHTSGLYIKPIELNEDIQRKPSVKSGNHQVDEWSSFQNKLGLSEQQVELLKSQKDQRATMELVNRFMRENPKYVTIPADDANVNEQRMPPNNFVDTYHTIVEQLRKAQGTLKTSLKFELADKSAQKDLKRSRRKIAVRMVSDMPTDKIDELLNMFNEQYGLNPKHDDENGDADGDDTSMEYNEIEPLALPSAMDPDYMYENLYEDETDGGAPSSRYGSFQDLILEATRKQQQLELEETKLHTRINKHFV